jgi:hypothetical protein
MNKFTGLPLITFGKYKNQPITTFLADTSYVEWCKTQEWFKKYPVIYNICVNNTITSKQSSKTPEHNKLQNIFLENMHIVSFLKYVYFQESMSWFKYKKQLFLRLDNEIINSTMNYAEFEGIYNWDVIIDGGNICYSKHKLKCKCMEEDDSSCSEVCYYDNDNRDYTVLSTYIEIKPLVGEDYPEILRKMKTQIELTRIYLEKQKANELKEFGYEKGKTTRIYEIPEKYQRFVDSILNTSDHYRARYYLLIKDYQSSTTTKEQLIKIFTQEGISVVFVADVFSELDIRKPAVDSEQLSQEYQIQNPVEASSILVTQNTYLEKIDITDNIDKRVKILEDTNKKLEERIEQLEKIIKTLM